MYPHLHTCACHATVGHPLSVTPHSICVPAGAFQSNVERDSAAVRRQASALHQLPFQLDSKQQQGTIHINYHW